MRILALLPIVVIVLLACAPAGDRVSCEQVRERAKAVCAARLWLDAVARRDSATVRALSASVETQALAWHLHEKGDLEEFATAKARLVLVSESAVRATYTVESPSSSRASKFPRHGA